MGSVHRVTVSSQNPIWLNAAQRLLHYWVGNADPARHFDRRAGSLVSQMLGRLVVVIVNRCQYVAMKSDL